MVKIYPIGQKLTFRIMQGENARGGAGLIQARPPVKENISPVPLLRCARTSPMNSSSHGGMHPHTILKPQEAGTQVMSNGVMGTVTIFSAGNRDCPHFPRRLPMLTMHLEAVSSKVTELRQQHIQISSTQLSLQ